ncbi:hypothetical protein V6N11_017232 [Hibiscus sabdariffa]|uniref:KIB1-4 beta-propeller domain-containing protein n=1 Tax=Hibiscus sabdariffa TaxID=183260 RepID=A0ABR2TXE3_9ROSI
MGGWSKIPEGLVRIIEEKLDLYQDKVKCRCVCSSWRLCLPKMPHQKQNLLPWLLVPLETKAETSFGFFDPLEKKVHCLKLSDPHKEMMFRGSSHGWVVNLDKNNSICLINPLTGAQVKLPPRTKFPDVGNYRPNKPGNEFGLRADTRPPFLTLSKDTVRNQFLEKVVLSSSPQSDEDFVAVAIYGVSSWLAYYKRRDNKWSALDRKEEVVSKFSKGLVSRYYLVQSSGGLIMVYRHVRCYSEIGLVEPDSRTIYLYKTCGFRIFKLDTSRGEWDEIQSIGDDILFLGFNSSFSMSSKNFPGHAANCIYFTDDSILFHLQGIAGGFDIGIFNLSDGSIQHLPGYKTCESEISIWPPPVWFMPNFIN